MRNLFPGTLAGASRTSSAPSANWSACGGDIGRPPVWRARRSRSGSASASRRSGGRRAARAGSAQRHDSVNGMITGRERDNLLTVTGDRRSRRAGLAAQSPVDPRNRRDRSGLRGVRVSAGGLGGFNGRDTVGPFPLSPLFAAIGLGPTTVLTLAAFTVQALPWFLGCRAAADLACMHDAAPRPLSPMGRIGAV
jgi:hypothetical protein